VEFFSKAWTAPPANWRYCFWPTDPFGTTSEVRGRLALMRSEAATPAKDVPPEPVGLVDGNARFLFGLFAHPLEPFPVRQ
jgi:hypothetical protein